MAFDRTTFWSVTWAIIAAGVILAVAGRVIR